MLPNTQSAPGSRRKRPSVAEGPRKRASRACEKCRRMKEKCNGGYPCERCIRVGCLCNITDPSEVTQGRTSTSTGINRVEFFDLTRIKLLEKIVAHHTHINNFDLSTLEPIVDSISDWTSEQATPCPISTPLHNTHAEVRNELSPNVPLDFAELSHSRFSSRMQESVDRQLTGRFSESQAKGQQYGVSHASNHLYSQSPQVNEAVAAIPPTHVAEFLFDVFFTYAQTNYVYANEQWLRLKLRDFYTTSSALTAKDSPWICTLLMIFAIGTQFAHLSSTPEDESDVALKNRDSASKDDETALYFYYAACKLVPDVMVAASLESVQAFLLLGVFTLPLDTSGLSCTYLGIAIRIATQNDLHRSCIRRADTQKTPLISWVWWTTCTLERRVCILHGRPVSISRDEANIGLPRSLSEAQLAHDSETRHSTFAMIRFVDTLEEARDMIVTFKTGPHSSKASAIRSLLNLKQNVQQYWHFHPHNNTHKPCEPTDPAFRPAHHLALTYNLVHIFIGRPFIFEAKENLEAMPLEKSQSAISDIRDTIVLECVRSSLAVIDLLQVLSDRGGLARASYTESSTLCAALMVLLAKRMEQPNEEIKQAIEKGKALLNKMLLGIYSSNQEKIAVEVLEAAVSRLSRDAQRGHSSRSKAVTYANFQNWIGNKDCRPHETSRDTATGDGNSDITSVAHCAQSPSQDVHGRSRFSQAEIDEMLVLPGLEDWFNFSYMD